MKSILDSLEDTLQSGDCMGYLDSEDVIKMRQAKENTLKQLQDTIEKKTNNAIQCQ